MNMVDSTGIIKNCFISDLNQKCENLRHSNTVFVG